MSKVLDPSPFWKKFRDKKKARLWQIEYVHSLLGDGKGPMIPMGKFDAKAFETYEPEKPNFHEWLPFSSFSFMYAVMSTSAGYTRPGVPPKRQIAFQVLDTSRVLYNTLLHPSELPFTQNMDLMIVSLWDNLETPEKTFAPIWIYNPARNEHAFPNIELVTQLIDRDELTRKAELAVRFLRPQYQAITGTASSQGKSWT